MDVTERRRQEDAQDLLIRELQHRIGNLMAIMRGLARLTSARNQTAEEYRDAFLSRFDALGRILDVTSLDAMPELSALARSVLDPYLHQDGSVVMVKGPTVALTEHAALGLGMILHELATNALKYGALSVPGGRVAIVWRLDHANDGDAHVMLRWRESGGPKVSPPASSGGFGTRLIQLTAENTLRGRVELNHAPDGLIVTLTFPTA